MYSGVTEDSLAIEHKPSHAWMLAPNDQSRQTSLGPWIAFGLAESEFWMLGDLPLVIFR